jgi:DMSO reductase anchor subunit
LLTRGTWPAAITFSGRNEGVFSMLWTIAVILLVLWLLGFSLHVAGGLIHILLVIAIIVGLVQLFTGRRV